MLGDQFSMVTNHFGLATLEGLFSVVKHHYGVDHLSYLFLCAVTIEFVLFKVYIESNLSLHPKVDSPPFAATVAAAAMPLQHYQVDPVHQPLGLRSPVVKDRRC